MKWSFLVWLFASVLFFTHSVTAQKPPFLVLNREERQEAVHTTKQAVQWWLGRKYSNLYSLYSSAASFLNSEGIPESERKARFIKWCSAWRERNPYNSRLSEDEKIERLRTVDVSIKLLTGFVLMNMKSSYWDALTKGKWHRDTKIAFVEFHIRGRRYIQPLIREDKRWKILTIPLTFDEQMIREYEGLRGDGTDRPHLIKGGASELSPRSSNNLCDLFGVLRYPQGSAQTPWRSKGVAAGEEGLSWIGSATFIPSRAVLITNGLKPLQVQIQQDRRNCKMELYACWGAAAAIAAACYTAVGVFWSICSGGCSGLAPWLTPLCIARCTWQARTLWIACTALFSTLMGICQSHYQQCVKEGGLP